MGRVGRDDEGWEGMRAAFGVGWDREVNPDFTGKARYARLDRMVMSDPVVNGAWMTLALPVVGSITTLRQRSTDPTDQFVAECTRRWLGLHEDDRDPWLVGGVDGVLWKAILSRLYGSITLERVAAEDVVTWRDDDGDDHPIIPIEHVEARYPHTLDDYRRGPSEAQPLASVHQAGVKGSGRINGERLIHLVNAPHLAEFIGSSVLRPAYTPWKLKTRIIVAAAVGFERWAYGVPIIRGPNDQPATERRAQMIGENLRSHEASHVFFPGNRPENGTPGWDLEMLNGAGTLADAIPQLRHFDEQIVSTVLARFLMLGSTDSGSRAVGEVLAEPFYQALNVEAKRIARDLTRQLVQVFVRWNFGPDVDVPELVADTIQQRNLPIRGDFLANASAAGVDFTDRAAQDAIREMADLPPLPDDWTPTPRDEGLTPPTPRGPIPLNLPTPGA